MYDTSSFHVSRSWNQFPELDRRLLDEARAAKTASSEHVLDGFTKISSGSTLACLYRQGASWSDCAQPGMGLRGRASSSSDSESEFSRYGEIWYENSAGAPESAGFADGVRAAEASRAGGSAFVSLAATAVAPGAPPLAASAAFARLFAMKLCNLRFFSSAESIRAGVAPLLRFAPTDEAPAAFARSCSSSRRRTRACFSSTSRCASSCSLRIFSIFSWRCFFSSRSRASSASFWRRRSSASASRRRRSSSTRFWSASSFARFSDSRRERDSIARCRRSITLPAAAPPAPTAGAAGEGAAAGFAAVAACLAAIIASLRARRSSSRRASAFFAASACRSAPSRLSAFFSLAGAAGFSSYPARGTNDVIRSGASLGRGGGASGSGSESSAGAAVFSSSTRVSVGCFRADASNSALEKSGVSASVSAAASRAAEKRVFSSASFATAASFFPKDFSSASGVFAGTDVSGVAAGVAATSAEGRPGVVPAPRAEAAAARASSLERREPDADLPALRVVGPRDDGCEPSPRVDASGAGVFAFAAFAAEASSFPATEAGEIRSISMTSASGPSRRAPSRDTEAGLVFLSLA